MPYYPTPPGGGPSSTPPWPVFYGCGCGLYPPTPPAYCQPPPAPPPLRPPVYGPFNPRPALVFQYGEPGQDLDYPIDLGPLPLPGGRCLYELLDEGDALASAGLQISPSGGGELTVSSMTLEGTTLTPWLSGGVGGREYQLQFTLNMVSGRVIVFPALLPLGRATAELPPDPPSWDFGPMTTAQAPNLVSQSFPAASLILSTDPCNVKFVHGVATQINGWLILIDANQVPEAGDTIYPDLAWPITVNQPPYDFQIGVTVQVGAVLLFSTGALPNVYTPSSTCLLAGETT